jgi:hypothetical protein
MCFRTVAFEVADAAVVAAHTVAFADTAVVVVAAAAGVWWVLVLVLVVVAVAAAVAAGGVLVLDDVVVVVAGPDSLTPAGHPDIAPDWSLDVFASLGGDVRVVDQIAVADAAVVDSVTPAGQFDIAPYCLLAFPSRRTKWMNVLDCFLENFPSRKSWPRLC